MKSRQLTLILLALLLVGCTGNSFAQAPPATVDASYPPVNSGQTNTDPPGRVARVQYMSGEVSIQPGGINDWIAASLNRPLTTSDRVWTDKASKAELNVGGAYIRLNSETSVTLTNVSDNIVQVQLDQGVVELTVSYLGPGQIYEVDTPNLAFNVMKPGVYRLNVYPTEDQTWVTVRKGQGEATGRGNAVKIKSGEQVRFSNGTSLAHTAEPAPDPDGFDDWASVRDKRLESSLSAKYVSPGVIGYQDLDLYGSWQTVAPYGAVWVPYSVPVGWAPYRFGRWTWIAPWGWTWVDDAAWGFAPFHYGRWVYTGGYWGWAPGPYRYWSTCYAPALVGWVGGAGWGVGVGFGFGGAGWGVGVNFGWFPLGWGEPYYPWYGGWRGHGLSPTYIRNVNVTNTYINNVTYITKNYYGNHFGNTHYVNRNINGAVTAAPQSAIAGGQAINRAGVAVNRSQLMHAPTVRGVDAIPTREARLGGQSPRTYGIPPSGAGRSFASAGASTNGNGARPTPTAAPAGNSAMNGTAGRNVANGFTGNNAPQPAAATNGPMGRGAWSGGAPTASAAPNVPRPPRSTSENADVARTSSGPAWNSTTHAVPRPSSQAVVRSPATAAASSVPRPPAGYTYRAAPAYTPSASGYRSNSFAGGGQSSPNYSNHSYGGVPSGRVAPTYGGGGPTGGYAVQHSAPAAAPHYSGGSGGSAPHYSAPSGGGGGSASHASHGGGSNHNR